MKKYVPLLLLIFALSFNGSAQYVNIADATFLGWLQNNGYAGCLTGSQLDYTCVQVQTATSVFCGGIPIADLTGIEFFPNLDTLDCSSTSLTTWPIITSPLTYLNIQYDQFDTLPTWVTVSNVQTLI